MRTNDDGQGVIDGVDTQEESRKKAFKKEKKTLEKLFRKKNMEIAELVAELNGKESYKNLNQLESIRAFVHSMNELRLECSGVGRIAYTCNAKAEVKVQYSYAHSIRNTDGLVVGTETRKIKNAAAQMEPEHCYDYDYYLDNPEALEKPEIERID